MRLVVASVDTSVPPGCGRGVVELPWWRVSLFGVLSARAGSPQDCDDRELRCWYRECVRVCVCVCVWGGGGGGHFVWVVRSSYWFLSQNTRKSVACWADSGGAMVRCSDGPVEHWSVRAMVRWSSGATPNRRCDWWLSVFPILLRIPPFQFLHDRFII